jgi:hypothetical protein
MKAWISWVVLAMSLIQCAKEPQGEPQLSVHPMKGALVPCIDTRIQVIPLCVLRGS